MYHPVEPSCCHTIMQGSRVSQLDEGQGRVSREPLLRVPVPLFIL